MIRSIKFSGTRLLSATRQRGVLRRAALSLAIACCVGPVASAADAYRAHQIWTGDGQSIENGVMIVDNGVIIAVGPSSEIEIPDGCETHELGAATLIPGIVAAQTTLAEGGNDEEESLTPFIRAIDGFDFFADRNALLAAGVTTVQLSPGSGRLMPGQGAVVKLAGDDIARRAVRDTESLRILLTQSAFNPPRIYEPPVGAVSVDRPLEVTRPQLASNLADAVAGLRALMVARQSPSANEDPVLSALNELIGGGSMVRITARSAAEITAATQLADEFQLPVTLIGVDELDAVVDGVPWSNESIQGIILETERSLDRLTDTPVPGPNDRPAVSAWERLAMLNGKGVLSKVAITTVDNQWDDIWFAAGQFVSDEVTTLDVLGMLTANPARLMGVDSRVGSLTAGHDADFVVLSGLPFDAESRVLETYVDGVRVYDRAPSDSMTVVRAAAIYTPSGVLTDGAITIADGKIRGVGSTVSFPSDAKVVDFGSAVIIPGFVDLETKVGTGSSLGDRVNLNDKLGPLLVSDDAAVAVARQGGVTTGLLASTNLPSPVLAFKLSDVPRVIAEPVAIRYSISGNLTSEESKLRTMMAGAKSYVETWAKYDAAYADYQKKLAEYEQAKAKYDAEKAAREKAAADAAAKNAQGADASKTEGQPAGDKPAGDQPTPGGDKPTGGQTGGTPAGEGSKTDQPAGEKPAGEKPAGDKPAEDASKQAPLVEPEKPKEPEKPRENAALEPYKAMFAGKIPAIVGVEDAKSLAIAVKIFADEFKVRLIIAASGTADRDAGTLAGKSNVSVVLTPPLSRREDGQTINVAERFLTAGVPVTIASGAGTGAKQLPAVISQSVYRGLGREDALASLTNVPAKVIGIKGVGQIIPAADADLVVLSGPPFQADSRVLAVMIDGQWVHLSEDDARVLATELTE